MKIDMDSQEAHRLRLEGGELWQNVLVNLSDSRKAEQNSMNLQFEAHDKLHTAFEDLAREFDELRKKYTEMLEDFVKCQDRLKHSL